MLETLNTAPRTIREPKKIVIDLLSQLLETVDEPVVAEIGVGVGATTLAMSELLAGRGAIHIFDFQKSVDQLAAELAERGFDNVVPFGNTDRYWDSYNWALAKLIKEAGEPIYDLVFLDGAHTYLHDALAFYQCDLLLKEGGILILDDYEWCYAISRYMKDSRQKYMTDEQINAQQVALVVDTLVKPHPSYEEIVVNVAYRKRVSAPQR